MHLPPCTHRKESFKILIGGLIRAAVQAYQHGYSITLILAFIFIPFAGTGGILTPRRVFIVLSLVTSVRLTSIDFLLNALFLLSDGCVAARRIQVPHESCIALYVCQAYKYCSFFLHVIIKLGD